MACGVIERRLSRPVQSMIVSLGGFPAPRAEKYLRKKLFGFDPDYIVIQLGATDAQRPIRTGNRPADFCSSDPGPDAAESSSSYHSQPVTALSILRWQLASVIGDLRRIEPITPLSSYIAAIERMVNHCRSGRYQACHIVSVCIRIAIYDEESRALRGCAASPLTRGHRT